MVTDQILIKRYGGLRLYDVTKARYVSVKELRQWQAEGIPFVVRDAEKTEDVTRVLSA